MDNIKNPVRRYGDYLNCKPDADAILLELEQIKQTVEALAEEGVDKNIAGITLRVDYGTGMIRWGIDVIPEDVERYPINDARITFDSEKQRDEFKALLEKEGRTKVKKNINRCCANCKYWTGKDELGIERCIKHNHLMWGTADPCKDFEFKEEEGCKE